MSAFAHAFSPAEIMLGALDFSPYLSQDDAVMNSFSVLDSLFDPANPSFTEKGVQTLLDLRSSEAEAARLEELAEKANEGQLSPNEQREYEDRVRTGTFISLLQAKARVYRKRLAANA